MEDYREAINKKVNALPQKPGVYIMKDSISNIIYIGKAKSLKNRVSQYFQNSRTHSVKVKSMVDRVREFDYIVTNTEFEALVLECNLIKLHRPKYNILLKDDKAYPFIRISLNEQYPRISLAYRQKDDGARYFGPYRSAGVVNQTIAMIRKIMMIPACKKRFPEDIGKGRPCLNYQIKRCMALCTGQISKEEYRKTIDDAIAFIEGDFSGVIKELENKMFIASNNLEFEKAAILRDRIGQIRKIGEKQTVFQDMSVERDIISAYEDGFKVCFTVLSIRAGRLIDKDSHIFDSNDIGLVNEAFGEFIKAYYTRGTKIPKQIIVDREVEDIQLIAKLLSQSCGHKVEIRFPQKGDLAKLIEMAQKNAREELSLVVCKEDKQRKTLLDLKNILGLHPIPLRIEAYDISNTGSDSIVGAMVVFENGIPAKGEYRMFKVRSASQQDDYAAMKEIIYRRLSRADEGDEKFNKLPDLILLDGGAGHVSAVKNMFEALDIHIPVFGMVKDKSHRTRDLIGSDGEVGLLPSSPIYVLIGTIQEEVHRFAINYHKKLRGNKSMSSVLDNIEGLGAVRREKLLSYFKTVKRIKDADIEDIMKVKGIPADVAKRVYQHLHED